MEKFHIFLLRASEALPACLLVMVQGNLDAITVEHWIVAARTGAIAGAIMVCLSYVEPKRWLHNRYTSGLLTGIATAVADNFSHAASFTSEAIVTGLAAAVLCILYSFVIKN